MNREDLLTLCEDYVSRRRAAAPLPAASQPPLVPEIVRSYRLAEISASEKNSLLIYVCGLADDDDIDNLASDD
ncbi:MAG: hypothetical protein EBZ59_01665 [Planctomycetia bacterium]|nr:hypothetical protein [Planctomycetia bacterium]